MNVTLLIGLKMACHMSREVEHHNNSRTWMAILSIKMNQKLLSTHIAPAAIEGVAADRASLVWPALVYRALLAVVMVGGRSGKRLVYCRDHYDWLECDEHTGGVG